MTDPAGDAAANPWRLLASAVVHSNPWFRVRHDRVRRPDGRPGDWYVVETADNAGVVALDAAGRVCLVGEWVYPLGAYGWAVPSGAMHPDETPLAAAQRELREETGLIATRWEPLGRCHLSQGLTAQASHLFLATALHQEAACPEPTERLAVAWLPLEEAWARACQGELTDAVTLVGLAWARARLRP
jgi:8-oxo-dGTP pyrophosphatase MutT (NUDIX family)